MTTFQFPLAGSFASFGNGCRGSAGTPYLFAPLLPYLGESLSIVTANLPPTAVSMLVLGASKSVWGGLNLPVDLTPFGANGCNL